VAAERAVAVAGRETCLPGSGSEEGELAAALAQGDLLAAEVRAQQRPVARRPEDVEAGAAGAERRHELAGGEVPVARRRHQLDGLAQRLGGARRETEEGADVAGAGGEPRVRGE